MVLVDNLRSRKNDPETALELNHAREPASHADSRAPNDAKIRVSWAALQHPRARQALFTAWGRWLHR